MADVAKIGGGANGQELLCPACRVDLVMSERQGIEIDYCPKCRGVWLDRGELDKIIERSASAEVQTAQAEPYAPGRQTNPSQGYYEGGHGSRHGGHGDGHGHGRKRSFWSDLFD